MKYLTLFVFIMLVSVESGLAQKKSPARYADASFNREQYSVAIDQYKKAYTKVKKNKEERNRISYQLAECYRLTGSWKRAEAQYKRLIAEGWDQQYPTIILHYADALKINMKYDEAEVQYLAYAERVPEDPRGLAGAETCNMIQDWMDNPSKYEVTNIKKINSRESDFSAVFSSPNFNEIVFTSAREGSTGKGTDGWTDQAFSDLWTARIDRKQEWSTPVLIDEAERINTDGNEGAAQLNSKFNTMYFTRCPNEDKRETGCSIYKSRKSGRNWSDPEMVEIKTVDTLDVVGHPTVSESELVMYFSSLRKGGLGGRDIWVTFRDSKSEAFRRPQNLGDVINTPGDELFPFLRNDTTLYFASNGHGGMGGLDIFVTTIDTAGNWGPPENLKYPINSSADDFGISFSPEAEEGFLSSTRKGGRGAEDIYYFIEPPLLFTIAGTVTDDQSLQPVENAEVALVGSDGMSMSTRTNQDGYYLFGNSQIGSNTTYDISVSKDKYFSTSATETTVGLEFSKDIVRDFVLVPIPQEPIVLPEILYDLAKWDLKPQYEDSLQGLIQTLQDNPTIVVELMSHTDARDTEERNDILSQKRAQSVVDYLIIRGIDPDRLVAKGYGERQPRTLTKDLNRDGYLFASGLVLTEDYINSLSTTAEKEAAHQLNRRTEFRILRNDFVPKTLITGVDPGQVNIQINPDDNQVKYKEEDKTGVFLVPCIINGYSAEFAYEQNARAMVSEEEALRLLTEGQISKDDFKGDVDRIIGDGTIANRAVFVIDEIRIADQTVTEVEIMVSNSLRYKFVFGNRLLSQFGNYTFDTNAKLLIFE